MSLRARIFIIISILVFLILGVSLFLSVRNKNKTPITDGSAGNNTSSVGIGGGQSTNQLAVGEQVPTGVKVKTVSSLEAEKNNVEQLAKVFVERYGTYSSDNNFQNIKDVETLVTESLWSKISSSIKPKTTVNASFSGITTKVVSVNLSSWSDTKASVELETMRIEEKNGSVNTHYQNVSVEMVKTNQVWLADKLVWN